MTATTTIAPNWPITGIFNPIPYVPQLQNLGSQTFAADWNIIGSSTVWDLALTVLNDVPWCLKPISQSVIEMGDRVIPGPNESVMRTSTAGQFGLPVRGEYKKVFYNVGEWLVDNDYRIYNSRLWFKKSSSVKAVYNSSGTIVTTNASVNTTARQIPANEGLYQVTTPAIADQIEHAYLPLVDNGDGDLGTSCGEIYHICSTTLADVPQLSGASFVSSVIA
jgi:hypothetical protein